MLVPFYDAQGGGVQTQARELVRAFESFSDVSIEIVDLPQEVRYGAMSVADGLKAVRREVARRPRPFDVFHLHFLYGLGADAQFEVCRAAQDLGSRTVVTLTSTAHVQHLFAEDGVRDASRILNGMDAIVALNRAMCIHLADNGIARERTIRIGNGVDTRRFLMRSRQQQRMARKILGISDAIFVLGYVGRLVPRKGIETLLTAWQGVERASGHTAKLVIVGAEPPIGRFGDASSIPYERSLKRKAQALELRDVIWAGATMDDRGLQLHYQSFDALALVSQNEGMPNCILEAMSSGVAVVATRIPGITDLIEDGENGILVTVDDPNSLLNALTRLRSNAALCRRMGCCGRSIAVRDHDVRMVAASLCNLYRRLACGSNLASQDQARNAG